VEVFAVRVFKTKPYVDNWLLNRIIRDDGYISRDERFLLLILASYRHIYTLDCNPPIAWLITRFGRSESTIRRTVGRLEEKGYLVSIRRGFNLPNHYYFASDFKQAFMVYNCPKFEGQKTPLLKANRKRWALKKETFDCSGSVTKDEWSIYKEVEIKKLKLLDGSFFCPHCHPNKIEEEKNNGNTLG
jgi:hypothetical protein